MVSGSVPFEFVGRARAFRARVGAEDDAIGQAVLQIMAPLTRRRPGPLIWSTRTGGSETCHLPGGCR
jgi:hypothetical protein